MLVILPVNYKTGAVQAGLASEHPLSSSTCSRDCCALGLGLSRALPQWAQSPGQSTAFSLMSSPPPTKRLLQKASFEGRIQVDREGPGSSATCSNDRQALIQSENWGLGLWPSVCWWLRRTKCWVMPASSLQESGAGCCFLLHICKATTDFWILSSVRWFGEIMLEHPPGPRSFASKIYRENSKLEGHWR